MYLINQTGRNAIEQWLSDNAKTQQNIDVWVYEAENKYFDATSMGWDAHLELPAYASINRQISILNLDPSFFDYSETF